MLKDKAAIRSALPLLVASSRCHGNWAETLAVYTRTCKLLHGVYRPSKEEFEYGMKQMQNSWGATLFYYGVVKGICEVERPNSSVVTAALARFRSFRNYSAMKRILSEDIDVTTYQGARSALSVAAFGGLWEDALRTYLSTPKIQSKMGDTRMLLNSLVAQNDWKLSLTLFLNQSPARRNTLEGSRAEKRPSGAPPFTGVLASPLRWNPFICSALFSQLRMHRKEDYVLRLTAASLAAGYPMDATLFASVSRTILRKGMWRELLQQASDLNYLSASPETIHARSGLYGTLVDALYSVDLYSEFTPRDVIADIRGRLSPRVQPEQFSTHQFTALNALASRQGNADGAIAGGHADSSGGAGNRSAAQPRAQFRIRTMFSVYKEFSQYLLPLSRAHTTLMRIPKVRKGLAVNMMNEALENNDVTIVLDTNFLLLCAAKNLPLEHFFPSILQQYPHLRGKRMRSIVVPFTVIRETHRLIWGSATRMRRGLKVLMWMRVQAILNRPDVITLTLANEFPAMAFSMVHRMALYAMNDAAPEGYSASTRDLANRLDDDGFIRADAGEVPASDADELGASIDAETSSNRESQERAVHSSDEVQFSPSGFVNISAESNPDMRILNLCLAYQYTSRARRTRALMRSSGVHSSEGTVLFSFLKYHVRRLSGKITGPASDDVLLVTLDKRFSMLADNLGIDTFPNYCGKESKCMRVAPSSSTQEHHHHHSSPSSQTTTQSTDSKTKED